MANIVFLLSFLFLVGIAGADVKFGRTLDPESMMAMKKEKLTHLRFYWHDVMSGNTPTSVTVVPPVNGSKTAFGAVNVIDNRLTSGPDIGSKIVGRAQGIYALTDLDQFSLLIAQNFVFLQGEYNGSTITVLGRNAVAEAVREIPIVGGSGVFRYARGYVELRTYNFDPKISLNAIVQYDVFVLHY